MPGGGGGPAGNPASDQAITARPPRGQAPGGRDLRDLVSSLSLREKVDLLTGADSWTTRAAPAIGLRQIVMSDGPAGARGTRLDERHPSTSLPCPSALGATWDPELVRELAFALGTEARAKGIDVLLGPTINLMRTPLGGRGFECFSEDPLLTSRIAVGYVRGLQAAGVAATAKHFVANDSETGRRGYDARVSEEALREVYLAPFEASVREAGVAVVMAAYNKVNGVPMTRNARLLAQVLKGEWRFGGVVTSDWGAAAETAETALAAVDLVMPGPDGPWGERLAQAVTDGLVGADVIDDKVLRLLGLAVRVGALDHRPGAARAAGPPGRRLVDPGLLRRATAASFVLLSNPAGILPLAAGRLRRLAVIGPGALRPTIQGGGSAVVVPAAVSVPAAALAARLAGQAQVSVAEGCRIWDAVPEPPAGSLRDPVTGEPGLRLEFRDAAGRVIRGEHREASAFAWWDGLPPGVGWGEPGSIVLRAVFRPQVSGPHCVGGAGVGWLRLTVDGETVADRPTPTPADPVEAMTRPGRVRAGVELRAGRDVGVELQLSPAADGAGPLTVRLGIAPAAADDDLLAEAVRAARGADAAVVIVGSAELTESEGFDRPGLALPGRQDELVRSVAEACPATIVVVNAGMPVLMPWAGQVAAVIQGWLPGQAMGEALAGVLLGDAEPGGRLPVTIPAAESDCPVLGAAPASDGRLEYSEGLLIGYRGYDARGLVPRYPFGHGLGYTTWAYESAEVVHGPGGAHAGGGHGPGVPGGLAVRVTVRNTGGRPGREVIQAYLTAEGDPRRPVRVLAAFASVTAEPGEAAAAVLSVPARVLQRWDAAAGRWAWLDGPLTLQIGRSSRDLRLRVPVPAPPAGH